MGLSKLALFSIVVGIFLVVFEMRKIASSLDKLDRSVRCVDQSVTEQTSHHAYLAKTYMEPVLPPCWDYLSGSCVTCGSERIYWNLEDKNE